MFEGQSCGFDSRRVWCSRLVLSAEVQKQGPAFLQTLRGAIPLITKEEPSRAARRMAATEKLFGGGRCNFEGQKFMVHTAANSTDVGIHGLHVIHGEVNVPRFDVSIQITLPSPESQEKVC